MSKDLIRVILDTNVFVAAYWARSSASARLISACLNGSLQAQYSDPIKQEVMHILHIIKLPDWYLQQAEEFWRHAEKVECVAVNVLAEDPDDQKFLEAAMGGNTDFLVTNDDHLLRIGYIERTELLTPASALRIIIDSSIQPIDS